MFVLLKSKFFLLSLAPIMLTSMFLSCNVEAHRIGGRHSIGKCYKAPYKKNYSSVNNNFRKNETNKSINNSKKVSLFSNIIGPIMASFGLAAILSYFGLNSLFVNFFSIMIFSLLILSIVYFISSYLFMKSRRFVYCKEQGNFYLNNDNSFIDNIEINNPSDICLIGDFNSEEFSEQARRCFMHMQELWKNGDMGSLKIYLTDEMISAIENDLKYKNYDREVQMLSLHSEFLNINKDKIGNCLLANIRFFGVIKDNNNLGANSFDEIWIFQKKYYSGWLLAGIQKNLND
ncbi:TIM44-like translocase [Candidatus Kinetoplastibacterium blastocrithidii TCC012E]|uniref:TIM44-like translocase n=1 Tax=Candidatus Kinetoplastidibacterium blastocrithidiae TCC012E TaxID=1208922 RepID=M1LAJ0_9PROT|nr:Tim44-like domain-containing protein [Candidatus Kinetoplastibacterium blastocrithidii]AFZ83417.1 hypothetical protein CKBE_00228 [Candidatus Kinetoplastibacterium blastocrithidii (ex Strigomonas culicis)]AGF49513.1 TIM44-like translocase [Candidatus Kinetoplastibacterium blastocrithidii TCC012E]